MYSSFFLVLQYCVSLLFYDQTRHTKKTFSKGITLPWLYHCLYCTYVNDTNWVRSEEVQSSYYRSRSLSLPLFLVMIHLFIFFSLACRVHIYTYIYIYTQIFIAINLDTSPSSLLSSSFFVYFRIILIIRVFLSLSRFCSLLYDVMSQEGVSNLISFRTVAWSTECNYRT
jgi:hypothetical protein